MFGFLLLLLCAPASVSTLRVALLLHGESFREHSHQNVREVGEAGIDGQRLASLSHLVFAAQTLTFDLGADAVDIHVRTKRSGLEEHLRAWYGPYVRTFETYADTGGSVEGVMQVTEGYDAVLAIRLDVILKKDFAGALAEADRSRILFSFECGPENMGGVEVPRVADMLFWLPSAYFDFVRKSPREFINNHHAYQYVEHGVGLDAMRFMAPHEIVDSDPEKDRNRFYRLASRPERSDYGPYRWRRGHEPNEFGQTLIDSILHD